MKREIKKYYFGLLIITLLLCFGNKISAQNNEFAYSDDLTKVTGDVPDPNETPAGYWNLTDKKINIVKASIEEHWKLGKEDEINCITNWKDFLKIKHTIDCKFIWKVLPFILKPGTETIIACEFISNEFSTTSNIQTGINISLKDYSSIDILSIKKNYNSHQSEKREVNLKVPPYNETKTLLIVIDCYVGREHYTINYIYNWTNN